MPGRRPKPSSIKRAEGNPGKRKLPENEPQPAVERPKKPENLGQYGSEVWDELVYELYAMRVMTRADRRALEMACRAYQEYREAIDPANSKKSHYVASDAWKRFKSMLIEFGLTPSSRAKIEVIPEVKKDSILSLLA